MLTLSKETIVTRVRLLMDEQGVNESEFSAFETGGTEHDESRLDTIIEDKTLEALRYVYQNADESLVPWEKYADARQGGMPFDGFVEGVEVEATGTIETPNSIHFDSVGGYFVGEIRQLSSSPLYYRVWPDGDKYVNPQPSYFYRVTVGGKHYAYRGGNLVEIDEDIKVKTDDDFVAGYTAVLVTFNVSAVWRWRLVGLSSWTRMVSLSDAVDISESEYAMLKDPLCTGTWERPRVGLDYSSDGETRLTLLSQKTEDDTVVMDYVRMPVWETTATESQQTEQCVNVGEKLEDAFLYYLAGLTCMVLGDERQGGFFQQAAELMGKETKS